MGWRVDQKRPLATANPRVRQTLEGAKTVATVFEVTAVAVLVGGAWLAVTAYKSQPGAFLSISAPHVLGVAIAAAAVLFAAILAFFGYVLLLLTVIVQHSAQRDDAGGK